MGAGVGSGVGSVVGSGVGSGVGSVVGSGVGSGVVGTVVGLGTGAGERKCKHAWVQSQKAPTTGSAHGQPKRSSYCALLRWLREGGRGFACQRRTDHDGVAAARSNP